MKKVTLNDYPDWHERLGYKRPKPCSTLRGHYVHLLYMKRIADVLEYKEVFATFGRALAASGLMKAGKLRAGKFPELCKFLRANNHYVWVEYDVMRELAPEYMEMSGTQQGKIDAGEWEAVPWEHARWFQNSPYYYSHMLHMAEKTSGNVAFCESPERFKQDRYVSLKPGRYLTRFFGDVLTEGDIRQWAEKCAARLLPAELKFIESNDPDGWVQVYRDGPSSCMKESDSVRVYAHAKSVLRLAYMTQGDEIRARAIVREDTTPKQYIRVYPNTDSDDNQRWHTRMTGVLKDAGYVHGSLYGVLLRAIPYRGDDEYVMPYLDTGSGSSYHRCVELTHQGGEQYFIVGCDGTPAENTSGTLCLSMGMGCHECGDRYHEDEVTYVDAVDGYVCNGCLDNDFVYARNVRGHREWVRTDDAILCQSNDEWYTERGAQYHGIYQCELRGEWFHSDDMVGTSDGWVHVDEAVALDVEDDDGNSFAVPRRTVVTHDGRTIHRDDALDIDGRIYHKDDDIPEEEGDEQEQLAHAA